MSEPVPLILDVDTGIDDALALAYALRAPAVELVAITTLAGNVGVERTTGNTLSVLDWLGAPDVPVHRGASRPLVRVHRDAAYFHDSDGLGGAGLPPSERALGADRGPAAIVRLANARPGELTLVCLGPLTNLAIALNVEPRLPELLRGVVVMGGAYGVPGNITPRAEFNVFADPEAAAQVVAAPFPRLTLVGLDVTQQTGITRPAWDAIVADEAGDAATRLLVRVARRPFEERMVERLHLHDPLAVAVALDPSLVETERCAVSVGVDGEERGMTRVTGPGGAAVARTVAVDAFLDRFFAALALPRWAGRLAAAGNRPA